ncbi:MAG: Asp23/Gls24 family envelope stress response protein, partial [Clostridiales bacterium]|nr:Asp23/Gls24 family envelope stress response protein [Clostridiales bacterium]
FDDYVKILKARRRKDMEISKYTSKGGVIISEEAVSAIATNAAKDVSGVTGFSNKPADVVSTIKKGSLKVMSPVRLLQDGDDLDISIYINIAGGVKIQPVAEEVQRVVKEAVQNMTGKLVSKINVIIASVENEDQKNPEAPCETKE